ncbi:MAG: alpha/beta hydrolase [Firmicutes bacterium]|nr:alpha/beta hydrolase [Bacillota bacterium]
MNYIGNEGTTIARYWRIRHGAVDRDTSLAISVILTTKLKNNGFNVNFAVPWGQGHGGDYDLDQLFAWIGKVVSE